MTFILQREVIETEDGLVYGRWMIDQLLHSGFEAKETVEASCWIAAKQKLGFPLTPFQARLLDIREAA
jgi:hypothetical protein